MLERLGGGGGGGGGGTKGADTLREGEKDMVNFPE